MPRKSAAAAAVKPVRMSDEDFAALGRNYRTAAANVLQAKAAKDEYQVQLLAELEARGKATDTVESIIITRKRKRSRSFDIEALKRKLGKNAGTVIEEHVRTSEVDALVKAGTLPTELVDVDGEEVTVVKGIETVTWSAPYVDVTFRKA